ncbi:Tetratricopeptide repeat-containing protein [Marinobacter sp. LV10R510-11A]|uniref:PA2778 family cysteine peptidase n=1 Tax=Marinobacter sp. LV10R510-11A TaxID=1415568 RepID=UPI000BB7B98A|nr:PA2778 family cysteine peptidase [Marinobacter sp. LV10R510-11A]SOB74912.1 Tetratricopeptide repeat-containing protein [Marinobacter sp. LV10R510-11A]
MAFQALRLKPARLLLAALLGVILSGCASQPPWPDSFNTTTLIDVPFHPQEQYQCGPASLAMMLNTQDVEATPDELVSKVYLPQRKGALQVEMVAAARQYGMLVYPLAPELDDVLEEVKAGNPVLILQNLRFGWWPQWHFAVVIGYDRQTKALILHTGMEENYRQPASAFMATWDRSERWARVILPPEQIPATAEPLTFLMAAHDLETTQQTAAAKSAYKAAAGVWPDQPAALLGLGNIAYQQGLWSEAENYYRAMTEKFPDINAGWNNLAEALAKQGKPKAVD